MSLSLYLPCDAAALALGADEVVAALTSEAHDRGTPLDLTRTGSRGMIWLEPLLEIERDGIRYGFGPLTTADIPALFDGDFGDHPKALGPVEEIPFLARQTRLTFARCGRTDPLDIDAYRAHGGWAGLERSRQMTPEEIVTEVTESGLRGRGGAGFPTGIKWRTVLEAEGPKKAIVCNADEGDSGTFADRMLIEGDPFCLIEGMAIAGRSVGADRGYIYLRSEYPHAIYTMRRAIAIAQETELAADGFRIELRVGAGAYVCGEETALLNSLEGKRGTVRAKPPLPAHHGFMGRPTVVNNVITLASVPVVMAKGADHYKALGLGRSRGTIPLQVAGNVKRGGLFEVAFGMTIRELVEDLCGGTASGHPVKAVQIGGPLGAYFPPELFDTPLGYEECDSAGGLLGHAGLVVFDDTADMGALARFAFEFCAVESCGTCTPCRIGAVRGMETVDRILAGDPAAPALLADLCETMRDGSLCALGGFTPYPVESALKYFPEDFARQKAAAE
ncbi:NAD-dependent formate dehydrogenase beta subunit [Rhodovulum sp. P5]|uniref:NADH-ubiquinone oxidoreductase-F iron-sulfur binding region domain-containing protein n=1 Tax=Rhodovulum sp. P5 TaxID=1564506 RepID=UPI0009C39A2A|nr:NADH-ubiquinone oxidoreductase-F iron-sulfur binding region domain-containing protein [Rhodovulum sp. P5]ARE41648.1 NAD-dependent formate dehydrogenase beta subunit [Rhodovulum sp. P5]